MTGRRRLLVIGLALALAAPAAAETVFRLTVLKRGAEVANGVGVAVAEGVLLTNASLAKQGDQFLVQDPATEARVAATVKASDPDADLALVAVPGLAAEIVTLASEPPSPGRRVDLAVPGGDDQEGVLHSVVEDKDGRVRYRFTIVTGDESAGTALWNNCGELVGISDLRRGGRVPKGDENLGSSGSLPAVKAFLNAQEVELQIAPSACLSLEDQLAKSEEAGRTLEEAKTALEEERNQAVEEKAALEKKIAEIEAASTEDKRQSQEQLEALEARKAELEAQKAGIEERLRKGSQDLAAKQQEIDEHLAARQNLEEQVQQSQEEQQRQQEEFARQQSEQERRIRTMWIVGGVLGILVLVGIAVLAQRLRRRQQRLRETDEELAGAREQLELTNVTFPDVILAGEGPQGASLRLKINGTALARSEAGQLIGRSSADADYVIPVDSVSRRHARIRVAGDSLTIEDLGSTNGTTIDGVKLVPGEPREVATGASIAFGDITLAARFLKDDAR